MPRSLSALITTLKNTNAARVAHLLKIVAGVTTLRFTDLPESFTFDGGTWLPYLLWDGAIRLTRGMEIDGGAVRLSNIDLTIAQNIRDTDFEGAIATLSAFYLEANEAHPMFEGRITSALVVEASAEFKLAGFLEPTAISLPRRFIDPLCQWRFKSTECGYVGAETVCNKTFADCTTRAQTHRFSGFVHITQALTDSVEPPTGVPGGGTLGSGGGPGDWAKDGIVIP